MLTPYFLNDPKITNIDIKAKKPAQIKINLNIDHPYLYVSNRATKKEVLGFIDPKTDLFVTTLPNITTKQVNPNDQFRQLACEHANDFITEFILKMKALHDADPQDYDSKYKPLIQLNNELSECLEFRYDFYRNLQQQLDLVSSKPLPNINEYLLFNGDSEFKNDIFVTKRLPYLNPENQKLTEEQKQLVDSFLDVFVDEYNKKKLAWYFGAILSNIDMKHESISKAMIVTSDSGGSGKSTLINSLAKGLVTSEYLNLYSGFDNYFNLNDKFATSTLSPCRLHVFSEAAFEGYPTKDCHDFSGLDISNIKAWITEGLITTEQKYQQRQMSELAGMAIILTNTPPNIEPTKKELTRRFISVVIKSSDMVVDKAKALDMNEQQIYQFVQANAQAFANYFVSFYNLNTKRYQRLLYDYNEIREDMQESNETEYQNTVSFKSKILSLPYNEALLHISTKYNIDLSVLINAIKNDNNNIRLDDDYLYINSSKTFLKILDLIPLRNVLIDLYGNPVKKYQRRMFKIPKNI